MRTNLPLVPSEIRGAAEFNVLAKHILTHGRSVASLAEAADKLPDRVARVLKAAVAAGSTGDPDWAGSLVDYQVIAAGFIEAMRQASVFDRIFADTVRLPLNTRIALTTAALDGDQVAEGRATPIRRLSLAGATLKPVKVGAIVIVTNELARSAGAAAMALIGNELRSGVAAATDKTFLAGILDGISATGSAGSSAANVLTDIDVLLAAVDLTASSKPYFLFSPGAAKKLATKNINGMPLFPAMGPMGGEIGNVPVLVTDQLGAGVAALIDASQIAAGNDIVTLDEATQSTVELDDTPSAASTSGDSPPTPTATSLVSLWQTGSRAIKALRRFGYERLHDGAAASLSGVSY